MVVDLEDVHFPDERRNEVEWGDQLGFDVPGYVPPVEEGEVSETEESGHTVRVVGKIFRFFGHCSGKRVAGKPNVGGRLDCLLVGCHAGHPELSGILGLLEGIDVARFDDVPVFHLHVAVRFDQLGKDWVSAMTVGVFFRYAIVVHRSDGHQVGKHGRSPVVVAMEVGSDQVVDFFQACLPRGNPMDASGVSRSRVPGVDQDGFAGGRLDQGGGSTLHVHPVNVEGCSRNGCVGKGEEGEKGGYLIHLYT